MDEMSVQDIRRDYVGCLVMYKGVPYVFQDIDEGKKAVLVTLDTQEFVLAPFNVKTIHAVEKRIGLVNIYGLAVNVTRLPKRVMAVGMRRENTKFYAMSARRTHESEIEYDNLFDFKHKGLIDAINNTYPTLIEAAEKAKKERGTCAFDKQFAVNSVRDIMFYTGQLVGSFNEDGKIVLNKEFIHLGTLLGNYHEKTARVIKEAPRKG